MAESKVGVGERVQARVSGPDVSHAGIMLDIACGAQKNENFVGIDILPLEGVDIVHDLHVKPWPLADDSVLLAVCSHFVEHIPPVAIMESGTRFPFIEFMDEVWRVLVPGGQLALSLPHGRSDGFLQDPTHCNSCNEHTWTYFDPEAASGLLYHFYQPKPWRIETLDWNPAGNMEVLLRTRK